MLRSIYYYESRIHRLENSPKENQNIVKKLRRQLRKAKELQNKES